MDIVTLSNLNKLKTKTIVFVITSVINVGIVPIPPIKFPYIGKLDKITTVCGSKGSSDCTLYIEMCSETNLLNTPSWDISAIATLPMNTQAILTSTIVNPIVNKGDYFRVNIYSSGDVIGLTIEIEILI